MEAGRPGRSPWRGSRHEGSGIALTGVEPPTSRWTRIGAVGLLVGGLAVAGLWLVFTHVHGPTSYDRDRLVLGLDSEGWLRSIGAAQLLIALGLYRQGRAQLTRLERLVRAGFWLTLVGCLLQASFDLLAGPPLAFPLLGLALLLFGAGTWRAKGGARWNGILLLGMGALILLAFGLALLDNRVADRFNGFRVFGLLGYFVPGLGWAALGAGHLRRWWPRR